MTGLPQRLAASTPGGVEDDSMNEHTTQILEQEIQSFKPQVPSAGMCAACQPIMNTLVLEVTSSRTWVGQGSRRTGV